MGERQYYYFYGSTSEGGQQQELDQEQEQQRQEQQQQPQANGKDQTARQRQNGGQSSPANAGSVATENDSLVGECLISTDNDEEETPKNSQADFQQLLVSHGTKNGQLHSLTPLPEERNAYRSTMCAWGSCCSAQYNRLRRKHSAPHIVLIFAAVALAVSLAMALSLSFLLRYSSSSSIVSNPMVAALQSAKRFHIPWPVIDRAAYNDPITNFMNPTLFHASLLCDGAEGATDSTSSVWCAGKNRRRRGSNSKDYSGGGQRHFIFPFPTGAFWTNLVLPTTADKGLSYPIAVYPYAYKWSDTLLEASYPAQHRQEVTKAIHDYFFPDLTFGIVEDVTERKIVAFDPLSVTLRYSTNARDSSWETYLVQGSPYVTIKYSKTSPVITAFSTFTNVICPREDLDPSFNTGKRRRKHRNLYRRLKFGVCSTKTESVQNGNGQVAILQGVQFTVETQEGVRWIVFASELATLEIDIKTRTKIYVSGENGKTPYSGVLRFAIIPPMVSSSDTDSRQQNEDVETTVQAPSALDQIVESTGVRRLIYHAGVYPVTGEVNWSFRSVTADAPDLSSEPQSKSGRIGTVEFKFGSRSYTPSTSGPKSLLMLALPHHYQALPMSSQLGDDNFDLEFRCIKGTMKPIVGSTWSYDVPLHSPDFDGDGSAASDNALLSPVVRAEILNSLEEDIKLALPTSSEDVYGFGKQIARLAQLAHIARRLVLSDPSNSGNSTRQAAVDVFHDATIQLNTSLTEFLRAEVSDSLVYDANLGGIVTKDGLSNSNADFGNGRYNDHHFHYGYLLYACAILGSLDPTFVTSYGNSCDSIFYDIAHNSNFEAKPSVGPFFPGARHKVWFDGHSFASGLFPFGNGKSQESSSEAVNGYFGAYLWSVVRNGAINDPAKDESLQTDFARLLLAMEIQGARTYWQMTPKSSNKDGATSPYSQLFSQNYMVGNLGMLDALCTTWFGNEELYVHMINFLPVTAITGDLFQPDYAAQEYSSKLKPLGTVEIAWRGYVVADHAIDDPDTAWQEAKDLLSPMLDSGLSKSQLLFWISMRPGFNTTSAELGYDNGDVKVGQSDDGNNESKETTAACSNHQACMKTSLQGSCCPTTNGVLLDCCTK